MANCRRIGPWPRQRKPKLVEPWFYRDRAPTGKPRRNQFAESLIGLGGIIHSNTTHTTVVNASAIASTVPGPAPSHDSSLASPTETATHRPAGILKGNACGTSVTKRSAGKRWIGLRPVRDEKRRNHECDRHDG